LAAARYGGLHLDYVGVGCPITRDHLGLTG
jgi:hypothetical protein